MIAGERAVLANSRQSKIIYTKGAEYQIQATIPRCLFSLYKTDKRTICFPGFNHSNWYHVVADMGFQVFMAQQLDLIDAIVLPAKMKGFGDAFLEFFKLFDLELCFIEHPRKVQYVSEVLYFDRFTGRLSAAMNDASDVHNEVRQYFRFLEKCFMESGFVSLADNFQEKIFSTRRGTDSRVYEQVSEVEKEYQDKGYQIVHFAGMSIFEQMAAMHKATHFTGFHGANLTNVIFAHQCQTIEELITRELSGDFQTIAQFRGMSHSRRKLT